MDSNNFYILEHFPIPDLQIKLANERYVLNMLFPVVSTFRIMLELIAMAFFRTLA